MTSSFSIKQVAIKTGLTEDAIRHYEKIGLIPPPERKSNGHRIYFKKDQEMLELINCLKKAGMALHEMKPYIQLPFKENVNAVPELRSALLEYRLKVLAQMSNLEQILKMIDYKLENDTSLLPPKEERKTSIHYLPDFKKSFN